jgi:DNA repair protein RecN (Recombination protein N)
MLLELTIDNFAIIEHLQIHFGPAFSVLTGETGAGKSIIIDAVAALLGGKMERDQIRAGAQQASMEAVLCVAGGPLSERLRAILSEQGLLDPDEPDGDAGGKGEPSTETTIILRRDFRDSGRSVCRINGRAVPIRLLQEIGEHLVDIHGQGDHVLLLRPREQIGFLDRYGGLVDRQSEIASRVRHLRTVRQELETLRRDERELARRVDLLQYEVNEITSARLSPDQEAALNIERDRLANAEKLAALADGICAMLYEGDSEGARPAVDLLSQAGHLLADISRLDSTLLPQQQILEEITYQLEDVARTLRAYRDEIEFNPRRLEQVEARLSLIYNLRRKYGDSIEDILDYAERAEAELSRIEHAGERIEALEAEENLLLREIGRLAEELSAARSEVGLRLAEVVERELAELRMDQAHFRVSLQREEAEDGARVGEKRYRVDTSGIDHVAFLLSANPGEPLRPLAAVASGGETSRLMLALKNALNAVDEIPTLIFDEIDAGIGGAVGSVVGKKLRDLAKHHQVLCVTHLPQLASAAGQQFRVEKSVQGARMTTHVRRLTDEERVYEIAQMMGASTEAALQSAREMLTTEGRSGS